MDRDPGMADFEPFLRRFRSYAIPNERKIFIPGQSASRKSIGIAIDCTAKAARRAHSAIERIREGPEEEDGYDVVGIAADICGVVEFCSSALWALDKHEIVSDVLRQQLARFMSRYRQQVQVRNPGEDLGVIPPGFAADVNAPPGSNSYTQIGKRIEATLGPEVLFAWELFSGGRHATEQSLGYCYGSSPQLPFPGFTRELVGFSLTRAIQGLSECVALPHDFVGLMSPLLPEGFTIELGRTVPRSDLGRD